MPKSFHSVLLVTLLCLGLASCGQEKTAAQKRAEQEKVWRADKLQRSAKFYQILLDKYPDSKNATEAKQLLAGLTPLVGTPKPSPAKPAAKPAGTPKPGAPKPAGSTAATH